MQICKVSVYVRCSKNHVIPNKIVTVPEIRVLQTIHGGKEAVQDIVPIKFDRDYNHEEERARLRERYEKGAGNADEVHGLIAKLFSPVGRLPTTLREIGYDPRAMAEEKRRNAEEELRRADSLDELADSTDDDGLNEHEREAIASMQAREVDDDDVKLALSGGGAHEAGAAAAQRITAALGGGADNEEGHTDDVEDDGDEALM